MVLRGPTQKVLRWPILIVVFTILGLEFLSYLFIRLCVSVYECSARFRFRRQKQRLKQAEDFPSWCSAARELDHCEGRDEWKCRDESPFYDHVLIKTHMEDLKQLRSERKFEHLLTLLKLVLQTYNVGGINNHQLYNETHFGTKVLVHDFIQTVLECCIVVRDASESELTLHQKRDFFRRAQRWYGRTALLLSGGAAMGYHHIGVLKTLIEAKCLPQIISGASAGSLMSAFIAVRTDQEVLRDLCVPSSERFFRACEDSWLVRARRWWRTGVCFDREVWIGHLRRGVTKGDTTFLEAYRQYGRIINIAVTKTNKYSPPVILNYRSTPDVVIWSAVLASSAFPNFLEPQILQMKNHKTGKIEPFHVHGDTFTDGTIKNDIPLKEMQQMWNVNYFIVSQCNPHLVPFFFGQRGGSGRPAATLASSPSSGLRGGFVLAMFEKLLKLDIKKWFKLIADLDLLPLVFGTDWRFIYLQKLTGTVTIVPDAPLWAYGRILSDPNVERMGEYIRTGEKATWYKLCRISNHFRLEKMLIECSRHLDNVARKAGLPVARERFSHVSAVGGPGTSCAAAAMAAEAEGEKTNNKDNGETIAAAPIQHTTANTRRRTHAHHAHAPTPQGASDVYEYPPNGLPRGGSPVVSPPVRHRPIRAGGGGGGVSSSDPDGDSDDVRFDPAGSPTLDPFEFGGNAHAVNGEDEEGEVGMTPTADLLTTHATWKRGIETDTDITDEEEDRTREDE